MKKKKLWKKIKRQIKNELLPELIKEDDLAHSISDRILTAILPLVIQQSALERIYGLHRGEVHAYHQPTRPQGTNAAEEAEEKPGSAGASAAERGGTMDRHTVT